MIKQNLVVYSIPILFEILKELENELNLEIIFVSNKKALEKLNSSDTLILTDKKNLNLLNNLELKFPLKISKLIEKINVKMIKIKTKEQSEINIGSYILNLNARILVLNSKIIH